MPSNSKSLHLHNYPRPENALHVSIGNINLIYRRPETHGAVKKLLVKIYERREWTRKWSQKYIGDVFSEAMTPFGSRSPDAIYAAFEDMARKLDAEPKVRSVIFAVGGVSLAQDELNIGSVRLFKMTDAERERIRGIFYKIIDTVRHSDDDKGRFRHQVDEFLGAYGSLTAAEIPVAGDVERAKAMALRLSEPVLDFLQLIAALDEPPAKNIRIVGGGDLLARQPPRFVIAKDQKEADWDQQLAHGFRLELTEERIRKIVELGFQSVIDAIGKDEQQRNEFEEMLINAVHWIADAEKQERLENRITSYMTAMELFFTAADVPITRDLSESVAYILGDSLERRKEIKHLVARLYRQRSKVSHEGRRGEYEADVAELKRVTVNVVALLGRMTPKFTSKSDIQRLFADLRLSAAFDPLHEQPRTYAE